MSIWNLSNGKKNSKKHITANAALHIVRIHEIKLPGQSYQVITQKGKSCHLSLSQWWEEIHQPAGREKKQMESAEKYILLIERKNLINHQCSTVWKGFCKWDSRRICLLWCNSFIRITSANWFIKNNDILNFCSLWRN